MSGSNPLPFLLITGCPRSGTSLLAAELSRRYDIAIPFETHFIPVFHRWRSLYGDLGLPENRKKMLADIFLFTRMWLRASKTFDQEQISRLSILAVQDSRDEIVEKSHDYASLCRALFQNYAQRQGSSCFGDKSVFFKAVPLETLDAALDGAKIINITRDGRDVFLSWSGTWFGTSSVSVAARRWAEHILFADQWSEQNPDRILTIRYEDLLTQPEEIFSAIARFAGLSPRTGASASNQNSLANAMATAKEHNKLGRGIDPSNAGKYLTAMPEQQNRLFLKIAGEALIRSGYAVPGGSQHSGLFLTGMRDRLRDGLRFLPRAFGHFVKISMPLLFTVGLRPVFRFITRNQV